jgi:thiosulfate/3-mercaptopyruvate sulfurtransferase
MNTRFRWAVAVLALASSRLFAADLPGPLVTPEWLDQHRGEVTVLDVREDLSTFTAAPGFATDVKTGKKSLSTVAGHIPGALLLDYSKARTDRVIGGRTVKAMLPDRAYFETLMRNAGVSKGKPIVITTVAVRPEDLDTAARIYWSIRYYGDDQLAILDGGMAGWLDAGLAFSTDAPATTAGDWTAGAGHPEILADSEEVAKAASARVQLVDARPLPYFLGLAVKRPTVSAAGHIAGAVDFPTEVRAWPAGIVQHFLTPVQYRRVFAGIGIAEQQPTITYCNTGHMASGAWFVMSELLGNKHVKLYDGSMHEWTLENRPVVALN